MENTPQTDKDFALSHVKRLVPVQWFEAFLFHGPVKSLYTDIILVSFYSAVMNLKSKAQLQEFNEKNNKKNSEDITSEEIYK